MNQEALLLAHPSACLRYLVLRDIFLKPATEPEVMELKKLRYQDPVFTVLAEALFEDYKQPVAKLILRKAKQNLYAVSSALIRLGYLGFDNKEPFVKYLAEFLLARQKQDGTWPYDESIRKQESAEEEAPAGTHPAGCVPADRVNKIIPLATAFPLRGLAACGYATTAAGEKAYEALLSQQLTDGSWPVYITNGVYGFIAGYRRMSQSQWGCRASTTAALLCLSLHPARRKLPAAARGLDLLLGRETRDTYALGTEVIRMAGLEPMHGFYSYFARFDLSSLLTLCNKLGANQQDERVNALLDFILSLKNAYGLWENKNYPQAAHWISYDLLHALKAMDNRTDWISLRPRTPFRAYPKSPVRF